MNIAPFTSRDSLGRYYTENDISSLLVSLMDTAKATNILDLGCGLGSLSLPLLSVGMMQKYSLLILKAGIRLLILKIRIGIM